MSAPVVDAQALSEFLEKAQPLLAKDYLVRVSRVLVRRSAEMRALEAGPEIWQRAPSTRRLGEDERGPYEAKMWELWPTIRAGEAGETLRAVSGEVPEWLRDWATYWLHARSPGEHPWWARWSYRPETRTGALPLVLDDPAVLDGLPVAECYRRMAQAERFIGEILGSTRRFPELDPSHAPTVALAAVYGVYMFTMASWRMTTEFTQALPPFPNVVRTLLGIDRWEWSRVGTEGQAG